MIYQEEPNEWTIQVQSALKKDDVDKLQIITDALGDRKDRYVLRTVNSPLPVVGRTMSTHAAENGSLKCLNYLIDFGADMNAVDACGRTPLMRAAHMGSLECLKILLSKDVKVDYADPTDKTAIMLAAGGGRMECMLHLLAAGANIHAMDKTGSTALLSASRAGHFQCLQELIRFQGSVCCSNKSGKTPLMFACENGFQDCVDALYQAGAYINRTDASGMSPLLYAAQNKHHEIVVYLLNRDADFHIIEPFNGMTAFLFSAESGDVDSLFVLFNRGIEIDYQELHGRTALMKAADKGAFDCLDYLLSNNADVNIADSSGKTALCYATRSGHPECMRALLEAGADPNHRDTGGTTPLMFSAAYYNRAGIEYDFTYRCLDILLHFGADGTAVNHKGVCVMSSIFVPCHPSILATRLGMFLRHKREYPGVVTYAQKQLNTRHCLNENAMVGTMLRSGVMPEFQQREQRYCCVAGEVGPNVVSPLCHALQMDSQSLMKYVVVNNLVTTADMQLLKETVRSPPKELTDRQIEPNTLKVAQEMVRNPWPLVKLSMMVVSSAIGLSSPDREEKLRETGLPTRIQTMMMFQETSIRLCTHHWFDVPMTFNPVKYDQQPKARPLIYNWPVGLPIEPCSCHSCQGRLLTYSLPTATERSPI